MINGRLSNFYTILDVNGVDINATDEKGHTPLMVAASLPNKLATSVMARKLISAGVDLNKTDIQGHTALHYAVIHKNILVLRVLLDTRGIDIRIQDSLGNNALHVAAACQDMRTIKILVDHITQYRIKCDVHNDEGMTPLLIACRLGRLDIARFLVTIGRLSPMIKDKTTLRNARMWLETVLFIPVDLDPFNCPEQDIDTIIVKPADYVSKDCLEYTILYDWRATIHSKASPSFKRPNSAPVRILTSSPRFVPHPPNKDIRYGRPISSIYYRSASTLHGRESPTAFLKRAKGKSVQISATSRSSKELLPHFLALKAASSGILPPAVPLPEEEKTPSEHGLLENDDSDMTASQLSLNKLPRAVPAVQETKGKKLKLFTEKISKQKITVEGILSASNWAKVPTRRRKTSVQT